jgi:hypothetical protein
MIDKIGQRKKVRVRLGFQNIFSLVSLRISDKKDSASNDAADISDWEAVLFFSAYFIS